MDFLFLYVAMLNIAILKNVRCITFKQECLLHGEVYKSCSFESEYTCWMSGDRLQRAKQLSKRLSRCKAGCFCKKGLVREFPSGPCIITARCRNRKLHADLNNLPTLDLWMS